MTPPKFPIIVLSYNRPDYLEKVLDSLLMQEGISDRDVYLFQDGRFRAGTNKSTTEPSLIKSCIKTFSSRFPPENVFTSDVNLGTAMNIDRAERFVFEILGVDAGVFCEDDLVLGPAYLTVLDALIEKALSDERIGYVSAFGNYRSPKEEQEKTPSKLRPLHLLWAFGLTKRHWLKCRPYVNQYLDLVRGVNYRDRDHEKIRQLTDSWGIKRGDTAQDRIKCFATALVGAIKVNTEVAYGTYIGEVGISFTSEMFKNWGFISNNFFDAPLSVDFNFKDIDYDPWHPSNVVWRNEEGTQRMSINKMNVVMTNTELSLFRAVTAHSQRYLEFGCGGSTCLVSESTKKWIISIDSSSEWIEKVKLQTATAATKPELFFVDVGPTGGYGTPVDMTTKPRWPKYHETIWADPRASQADFYLVDGRFRVACAMQCLLHCQPGAFIAIHDFNDRLYYHAVKPFLREIASTEQLSVFVRRAEIDYEAAISVLTEHRFDPR